MNNAYLILLNYVIEKSYTDPKAMDILNKYDSFRTRKPLETIKLVNSLIRSGHLKIAKDIVTND